MRGNLAYIYGFALVALIAAALAYGCATGPKSQPAEPEPGIPESCYTAPQAC